MAYNTMRVRVHSMAIANAPVIWQKVGEWGKVLMGQCLRCGEQGFKHPIRPVKVSNQVSSPQWNYYWWG